MSKSLISERLSELGSAYVTIENERILLKGFLSEERLHSYYDDGINCFYCDGIYPVAEINPHFMPDDALLVILENGIERKSKYVVDKKMHIEYKSPEYKSKSKRLCKFRRDVYSGQLNYVDDKYNLRYESVELLEITLLELYGKHRFLEIPPSDLLNPQQGD